MSTLTLVRHGQAEAFQKERSELTSIGRAQAASLAAYWLRLGVSFDEVQSGEFPRQIGTEQVVADAFRASGKPWPEVRRDAAWNEYDAVGVMSQFSERQKFLRDVWEDLCSNPSRFQPEFEKVMLHWLEGGIGSNGFEPFTAFSHRVTGAIQRIMSGPPSRRVVVFTSGGPIGFAVHYALQAPPKSFLDVNWRVRNASVSEFIFDRERFTLDSFNGIPHLVDDKALLTWR